MLILNPNTASTSPTDLTSFQSTCATGGHQAKCCVLPIVSIPLFVSWIFRWFVTLAWPGCALSGPHWSIRLNWFGLRSLDRSDRYLGWIIHIQGLWLSTYSSCLIFSAKVGHIYYLLIEWDETNVLAVYIICCSFVFNWTVTDELLRSCYPR